MKKRKKQKTKLSRKVEASPISAENITTAVPELRETVTAAKRAPKSSLGQSLRAGCIVVGLLSAAILVTIMFSDLEQSDVEGEPPPHSDILTEPESGYSPVVFDRVQYGIAFNYEGAGNAAPLPSDLDEHFNTWPDHADAEFTLPVSMEDGESVGILTIPDLDLSVRVYGGDEMAAMEKGLAHFSPTSAWGGNVGILGHNINFDGTPGYFLYIYRLQQGAVIRYETVFGVREFVVETVSEISAYDWSFLERTADNRITLITCISGRPELRLAVQAVED